MRADLAVLAKWKKSPATMVREMFKVDLDDFQEEILEMFADPNKQRLGLKACVGPGKSTTMVWCAINLMVCYGNLDPKEHPEAAVVSVSADALRDNFWKELAVWYFKSPLLQKEFELTSEKFFNRRFPKSWFLSARAYPRKASKEQLGRVLSGLHSNNIAYFLDESGQMPIEVLLAAEQGLSNCRFGKILQAGNPMAVGPEWMLHTSFTKLRARTDNPDGWHFVSINNDPDNPRKSVLPNWEKTLKWCRQMIRDWGRDNAWVKYAVFGEFPPSNFNTLISPEQVEEAMARQLPSSAYHFMQKRFGVDVAFQGDDMSVIFPQQGLMHFEPEKIRLDLTSRDFCAQIASRYLEKANLFHPEVGYVDATGGYGQGVIEALDAHGFHNIQGVQFSAKATNKRYYNKRTEMWWDMITAVKNGAQLPPSCTEMVTGLSTATYTLKNGLFLLEPKEIMKQRLGRSPDTEDACALNYAQPLCPAAEEAMEKYSRKKSNKPETYANPVYANKKPNQSGYRNPAR